jgi:hypothetical protein
MSVERRESAIHDVAQNANCYHAARCSGVISKTMCASLRRPIVLCEASIGARTKIVYTVLWIHRQFREPPFEGCSTSLCNVHELQL